MKRLSTPSLKVNTTIVVSVILLLSTSLAVLFYYSRQSLKQEAIQDAEQTLEATILHVDNVLHNVQQAAGNFYIEMSRHLNNPDRMFTYCRKMVESYPSIDGCAIAFKPGFFPDRELFMAYVHRKENNSPELITSEMFGERPYIEQAWYLEPMSTGKACWINPLKDENIEKNPIITFSLPIRDRSRECVGILGIDLSVEMLSQIVLAAKPSPNSYSIMLDTDGSFIIHPEPEKLLGHTVFSLAKKMENPTIQSAAEAMLAGQTGNRFFSMNGKDYFVFFKPFARSLAPGRTEEDLKWSIGLVFPEEDIFAGFDHLLLRVLTITVCGLLLFFILSRLVFRIQLKPLRKLTEALESMTQGNFNTKVSKTRRNDEVGLFQQHFRDMQEKLNKKVEKKKQLTATLEQRRDELQATYDQVKEDNRVQTDFLRNMTNQLIEPSEVIINSTVRLCNNYQNIGLRDAKREVNIIREQSDSILSILVQMLNNPDNKTRKEDYYE